MMLKREAIWVVQTEAFYAPGTVRTTVLAASATSFSNRRSCMPTRAR
jgi:hypothetical protein